MSDMYKSLRFLNRNTVTGLKTPAQDTDAFRLVDFREGAQNITNQYQAADQAEEQARVQGDTAIRNDLGAAITQLEAAYRAADQAEAQARQADYQTLVSGFTPKDPVYALLSAPVALSGLTVDTPSFRGAIPAGSRILVAGQGGDLGTAHADNGIYIAAAGAWARSADADEGDELVRSILVPIENGGDAYRDTIYFLTEPQQFANTAIGTTPLRFSRWLGTDTVRGDETSIHREGNVFSARLNGDQLGVGANGIEVLPQFINQLRNLAQATGLLSTDQIDGLLPYIEAVALNRFAAPTASVSFAEQRLVNLADPTAPLDGVNQRTLQGSIDQLNQAIGNLNTSLTQAIARLSNRDGFYPLAGGTVVDGDLVVTVTHNKNSIRIIEKVYDTTNGESIDTDFVRVTNDGNTCQVIFRGQTAIEPNRFELMVHAVEG
jgi:hypothetical protein